MCELRSPRETPDFGYYLQTAYSSNPHTPRKASLAFGPKTANQNTNIRIVLIISKICSA
jgi:hypothetical protein